MLLVEAEGRVHEATLGKPVYLTRCFLFSVHVNAHRARLAGGKFPMRIVRVWEGDPLEVTCSRCAFWRTFPESLDLDPEGS